MSLLTANGIPVSQAYISLPRVGRGVADLVLVPGDKTPPRVGGSVTLTWQEGRLHTLVMTCVSAERSRGWWRMRCEMGAGGLGRTLPSRYYEGIPAATVARDILTEAKEKPGGIDLPGVLPRYVRREAPAYQQLAALLVGTGRVWRITPKGEVWIGVDTFPPTQPYEVLQARREIRVYLLGLVPELLPGLTLQGYVGQDEPEELGRVERVVHRVGRELRTEVWCGD